VSISGEPDGDHPPALVIVYDEVLIVDTDDAAAFATYCPTLLPGSGDIVTRRAEQPHNHFSSASL
jgi:hypothetical protein